MIDALCGDLPRPALHPAPHMDPPLDVAEQPLLDRLLELRSALLSLKKDKSTYIKSNEVIPLYDKLVEEVDKLNHIRTTKSHEQNRLDRVLDDCFQLISLLFLTVGKNNEAPAVYATTSNITRLMHHLEESRLYCEKDLGTARHLLARMREILDKGKESYSQVLIILLDSRLSVCEQGLKRLYDHLSILDPRLYPVHEKMISLGRAMSAAATRQHFPTGEVKSYMRQLQAIDDSRVDGKFIAEDGSCPEGQEVVQSLLDRVICWANAVLKREAKVCPGVKPIYDELYDIRNQLEKISLTQAWSLRETDLFEFQRKLTRIDDSRVDGNFTDSEGRPTDVFSLRLCLYLLRRNYAYIFLLLAASEPVSEALLPIYSQLSTLRRCLLEVRDSGGVSSLREMYPYQMKLDSIDRLRVDGKFPVGDDIPEGQSAVNLLLRDCQNTILELRTRFDGQQPIETTDGIKT